MAQAVSIALTELLRKADIGQDVDVLREGMRVLAQALMELEVSEHFKAERYERIPERAGQRNGFRGRQWDTCMGRLS